ncbi:uncharacterized protein [Chlorocebus sabaeus]|uniref:uncharacterized protein isoform X3 n=1 Tax=Chlorocebus sabaeus TaxID=60711 RepID=UPI003BF99FA9
MVPYLDRDAPWVRTRDTRIFRGHLLTLGYPSSSQESAHFGIPFEFIGTTDCKDSSVPFGVPLLGPRHTLGLNQVTCLPALNLTFPSGAFVPLLGINSMSETLPASNQGLQCSRGPVPGLTQGIFSLIRGTTVWTETQPAFKPGIFSPICGTPIWTEIHPDFKPATSGPRFLGSAGESAESDLWRAAAAPRRRCKEVPARRSRKEQVQGVRQLHRAEAAGRGFSLHTWTATG